MQNLALNRSGDSSELDCNFFLICPWRSRIYTQAIDRYSSYECNFLVPIFPGNCQHLNFVLTSWFVHSFQPNSHQSAIHTSVEGKGSLIREAELEKSKPAPRPRYPPPPSNPGLQQDPTDLSILISDDSLIGMVLKRSEEVMEALFVNRFHLRGLDHNLSGFKFLQPHPNSKPRPSPKGYPPSPKSPLATDNLGRPSPKGYPPSPTTPRADLHQEHYNPAKITGLEKM